MKLRAAIVGAGLMGRWHATNVARAGGEVAAVCDVDLRAAQRLARSHRARVYAQIADALAAGKIDIVHVCTPLSEHFEPASAALSRGVHVLIEKPMAVDRHQTERLYQLAGEHRALLCPVHQFVFQRGVQQALAELPRIGQLRHFEATFCSAGGAGKSGQELDDIVSEILPHPLSLMNLFVPGSLREQNCAVHRPEAGEFRATLSAHGIWCSILISMSNRPTTAALSLRGTEGTTHVDLFHGFSILEPGAVSKWRKISRPFDLSLRTFAAAGANLFQRAVRRELAYPGLREIIRAFYKAVASGRPPPVKDSDAIEIAGARDLLRQKMNLKSQ